MLQVVGQSGTLRAAPDHKAVKAVLRLSDIKRPPHRPRYTLTGLSAARTPSLVPKASTHHVTWGLLQLGRSVLAFAEDLLL